MTTSQALSIAEARRIALAAQQFVPSAAAPRNVRGLTELVRALGAVQIDSVNVLVRSHYLPVFSRRGPYATQLLEQAAYADRDRTLFEYWGHEASLLPVELQPLLRWRMENARSGEGTWGRLRRYVNEHKPLVAAVLAQIRDRGALGASELVDGGRSSGAWWGWSQGKEILEWLFWTGEVTTARRRNFERLYDLPERVLPAGVHRAKTPSKQEAQRALMSIAAGALGVATLRDLRDYFRLPTADAAERVAELAEERIVEPVRVEGWKQVAYLSAGGEMSTPGQRQCAAVTVRFSDLGAAAHGAAVQFPLPSGDLHPRPQATPRLLRAAVSVGRSTCCARGSEGGSAARTFAGARRQC